MPRSSSRERLSQLPQVLVADLLLAGLEYRDAVLLGADPLDLSFEAGVQVDGPTVKLRIEWAGVQFLGYLVGGLSVFGHDEEQRFLTTPLPFCLGEAPAFVADHEMLLESAGSIAAGVLHQTVPSADDRDLDDARIHGLAQRRVADDMLEDVAVVVLGRGREVELGCDTAFSAAALQHLFVDIVQSLVPGAVFVPEVVGFIVENHDFPVRGDPLPQGLARIQSSGTRDGRAQPVMRLDLSRALSFGKIVKAVDVGEIDFSARGRSARFVLQGYGHVPVAPPGCRDERIGLEDLAVAEVLLETLEDGDVGSDDEKVAGQG